MSVILSDFDGVMTEQTHEADRVLELLREQAIAACGASPAAIDAALEVASADLAADPTRFGWVIDGKLSGFADEDLFIRNQGLAWQLDALSAAGHPALEGLQPPDGFQRLANSAYQQMAAEVMAAPADENPVDPCVPEVLRGLIADGHQVVVVSNSATDRVLDLLHKAGLDEAVDHVADPQAPLRVRGDARKYALGDAPRAIDLAGRSVDVDRPAYRAILADERPLLVIGDVASFDLALPLALARGGGGWEGVGMLLRTRRYTPGWARQAFDGGLDAGRPELLEDFAALPAAVARIGA